MMMDAPDDGDGDEKDLDPMEVLMSASSAIAHQLSAGDDDDNWLFDAATLAAARAATDQLVIPQQQQPQQQPKPPPQPQVRCNASMHPHQLTPDDILCVRCGYSGADVRIKGCDRECAFHARCLDLSSLSSSGHNHGCDNIRIQVCPSCTQPADRLEIIPLSFMELDRVQRTAPQRVSTFGGNAALGGAGFEREPLQEMGKKRSSSELDFSELSVNTMSKSKCYDPSIPRTGRWTDEELLFRDTIVTHFLEGSLPLSNGLKLNDFLSNILKSKQSRLTKKMKHAKLSTKYYRIKNGYIQDDNRAKEYSEHECNFIACVVDPVERSEIQFHMQKEWRDHLAERCTYLRIMFDADKWLQSVDQMDRRVVLEKNRSRVNKRRMLVGKALETDVTDSIPGVFINQETCTDDSIFEEDESILKQSIASDLNGENGDFGKFLMSMVEDGGSTSNSGRKSTDIRCPFDPNFRHAAPFLAAITSYMERNGIPFEHVDVWVPSLIPPPLDRELGSAPQMARMGSGANFAALAPESNDNEITCRLCFAGSATLNIQIINSSNGTESLTKSEEKQECAPLSADEIFNFSLYGDYSEKFSFSVGCGLPGRVFQTGIAAWEQFVSNAPSHMFERRGGAMQFGVKTALGLPIESPNVGRIVLVMYSRHNREKDEELVKCLVNDMRLFTPTPRWKLVVSVGPSNGGDQASLNAIPPSKLENISNTNLDLKENQIKHLIALLGENIPSASDSNTVLGQNIHSIMNLRLILLRANRCPEEEQLVDTLLVLYQSYIEAGRSKDDIVLLMTRDYDFHLQHNQRIASMMQQQQRSMMMSISPLMAPLSGPMLQLQGSQNQSPTMRAFDHSSSDAASRRSLIPGSVQAPTQFGSIQNPGGN